MVFKIRKIPSPLLTAPLAFILITAMIAAIFLFLPKSDPDNKLVFKEAQIFQASKIVVGQPVNWIAVVDRGLIASETKVQLPKTAQNIKIKNIDKQEVEKVLAEAESQTKIAPVLTKEQRQDIYNIATAGLLEGTKNALFNNFTQFFQELAKKIDPKITETKQATYFDIQKQAKEKDYLVLTYTTPAPKIKEKTMATGKLITVSGPNDPQLEYKNVLVYSAIPEIYSENSSNKPKIKWQNNNSRLMPFQTYDLNNNNKIDYIEWTAPHLSEQTFEIIFISKAFHLDQNKEIIEDIYEQVATKEATWEEGTYSTISQGEYIRVTFEKILDNTKDITIYAKPAELGSPLSIEVYTENGTDLIATFPEIDHEDTYRIFLTNLQEPTDVFDLKIIGASVGIDYIVDPVGWLTGYSYRKTITIQQAYLDASLSNFPLYVKFAADADLATALATGYDVRFTSSDGETLLKYEREAWSGGNGSAATADFWVKVPSIASTGDATLIYVYWGKAGDSDGADPTNVWDANFKTVYHMKDATTGTVADSTANGKTGTKKGANEPVEAAAKVAKGQNFDGTDDDITLSLKIVSPITISAVVKFDISLRDELVATEYLSASTFLNTIYKKVDGKIAVYTWDGAQKAASVNQVLSAGTWYHVAMTAVNSGYLYAYLNGVQSAGTALGTIWTGTANSVIAKKNSYFGLACLDGIIDEIRFSNVVRTAPWLKFEYRNIFEADNELTWGTAEEELAEGGIKIDGGIKIQQGIQF